MHPAAEPRTMRAQCSGALPCMRFTINKELLPNMTDAAAFFCRADVAWQSAWLQCRLRPDAQAAEVRPPLDIPT